MNQPINYDLTFEELRPRVRDFASPEPIKAFLIGALSLLFIFCAGVGISAKATAGAIFKPPVSAKPHKNKLKLVLAVAEPIKKLSPEPKPVPVVEVVFEPMANLEPLLMPGVDSPNGYWGGQCVWWVYERRAEMGHGIPGYWGNAEDWIASAQYEGWSTGPDPIAGAVGVVGNHVVEVESVNTDGSITVSEMNYNYVPYNLRYKVALPSDYYYIY